MNKFDKILKEIQTLQTKTDVLGENQIIMAYKLKVLSKSLPKLEEDINDFEKQVRLHNKKIENIQKDMEGVRR